MGSRNWWSLPDSFVVPSGIWSFKCSPLVGVNTSFALILRARISTASMFFQFLNVCDQNLSFPSSLRNHYVSGGTYHVKLSYRIGGSLDWSFAEIGDFQPLRQKGLTWPSKMVVQIAVRKVVSHLPGGLGHFADSNSIPQNQPTIFHEILIAAILLKILLSFVARLFQQCHSSRIDDFLKCDSRKYLHRICQTPMNCQCK